VSLLDQFAWHRLNLAEDQRVGTKLPNAFGLFDMHGSRWEWCHDFYRENWYHESPISDPQGPPGTSGSLRVCRGGARNSYPAQCRSAFRAVGTPTYRTFTHGFRVVRVLDIPAPPVGK
jgi:formylglycine-generating enzyme